MNTPDPQQPTQPVSRRNFLTSTSTAVVGGGLLGTLALERAVHGQVSHDTIRVALVGCGGRGSGAASQALSTEGDVKLVAVADAFKDNLERGLNSVKKQHTKKVE